MNSSSFLQVDREGFFIFDQERVEDLEIGQALFKSLKVDKDGNLTVQNEKNELKVEAFLTPIVAHFCQLNKDGSGTIESPYGNTFLFSLENLYLDEWDQFYGTTTSGIPFSLNKVAQNELFDQLDEFDDESITFKGSQYSTPSLFLPEHDVSCDSFWNEKYLSDVAPGWELNAPAKPLIDVLNQLKLPRCRVAVLGCGSGNDAAFFAEQGHIVTGFDFSPQAIDQAQTKYGHLENLSFLQRDVFDLKEFYGHFDLVFEHTCFIAVDPFRRNELVKAWHALLAEEGHLLGIFLLTPFRHHPPFTSSEWEIEKRLSKYFNNLYWTRWRTSITPRLGRELVVYSRKKNN